MKQSIYLQKFYNKKELLKNIKNDIINSREFVNIFLTYTDEKSDEDKDKLFNIIVDDVANIIVDTQL